MNQAEFETLLKRQLPEDEKTRRADFVIETHSMEATRRNVRDIVARIGRGKMATEIVIDTETTGLKPEEGHRIVEVGMVEIEGFGRTGRSLHTATSILNDQCRRRRTASTD